MAERVLDEVAGAVSILIVAYGAFAVSSPWNDGKSSGVTKRAAQPVGVIALASQEVTHATGPFEGKRGLEAALR